jgi:hypothetical protein
VVTVETEDQSAAVAVALAVVSEALRSPVDSSAVTSLAAEAANAVSRATLAACARFGRCVDNALHSSNKSRTGYA